MANLRSLISHSISISSSFSQNIPVKNGAIMSRVSSLNRSITIKQTFLLQCWEPINKPAFDPVPPIGYLSFTYKLVAKNSLKER